MDIINKYGYDDPQLMAILEGRRLPGIPPQARGVPDQILDLMMGQTEGRTAPIQRVQSVPYTAGPAYPGNYPEQSQMYNGQNGYPPQIDPQWAGAGQFDDLPTGMIPSGSLYKTPEFQAAVQMFIEAYGHEPATDSDFQEVQSMMWEPAPRGQGNIEQMVLEQMLGGYPSTPSGPAATGKPSGLTASGLARLESQRKVSGPSGPPPRRGPRV